MSELTQHDLDVAASLGRIEATLTAMNKNMDRHLKDDETVHKDQEGRLRKVERKQTWASGASAVVGAIIGGAVTLFSGR